MPTCTELIVRGHSLALSPDSRYCYAINTPSVAATPREHSGEAGMSGDNLGSARMPTAVCYPVYPTQV